MRRIVSLFTVVCLTLVSSLVMANTNDDFPGRAEYPHVKVMELSELKSKLSGVVVVDTRSLYEFETLRIKGSKHIPVAAKSFEQQVKELRASTNKPIVFYCNGRTCYKSYLAAKKSRVAGVKDVFAFDAGIFEWVKDEPNQAELLGKSPVSQTALIESRVFKARLLNPDQFSEKVLESGKDSMVLDVRDKYQRAGVGFFPGKERWVSLDDKQKLSKFLSKAKDSKKTLFIYDEVGKQVRWLQYALEDMGIKNYYFMDKGAKAYYSMISNWK